MSSDDRETPVRRVSTTALSLASIAAEALRQHLRRYAWTGFKAVLDAEGKPVHGPDGQPVLEDPEFPPGWVSRLASEIAQASRKIAQVERDETDRIRAELDLILRQRDRAIEELNKVKDQLEKVERERNELAIRMHRDG